MTIANANHVYKSETRAPSTISQSEIATGYADENHALADGLVDAIVDFVTATEETAPPSGAKHLLQWPPLRELVHELVEVADLLHERVLDLLDAHAADHACDQPCVRVQPRHREEVLRRSCRRRGAARARPRRIP